MPANTPLTAMVAHGRALYHAAFARFSPTARAPYQTRLFEEEDATDAYRFLQEEAAANT
jgi:hypothetical protein